MTITYEDKMQMLGNLTSEVDNLRISSVGAAAQHQQQALELGEPSSITATGFQNLSNGLEYQLQQIQRQQRFLQKEPFNQANLGAVIALSYQGLGEGELDYFFIAPRGGACSQQVAGVSILPINHEALFAKAMLGKRVGDSFEFNNTTYQIKALY